MNKPKAKAKTKTTWPRYFTVIGVEPPQLWCYPNATYGTGTFYGIHSPNGRPALDQHDHPSHEEITKAEADKLLAKIKKLAKAKGN